MRTSLSTGIFVALLIGGSSAYAFKILREASPLDIARLPKFCWAQAGVPGAVGPEYMINHCPGANHYCVGLLKIENAKHKNYTNQQRVRLLLDGLKDVRYTEVRTSTRPNCEIHGHVVAKRVEVENLLRIYGVQPAP